MTPQSEPAVIERKSVRSDLLPVSMAVAEYDRTRPLIRGEIKPAGVALKVDARYVGDFCNEPIYELYDAAEMSFSWYVTARSRGEPVIAIPVFPLRMPVLAYIFVRADSQIDQVEAARRRAHRRAVVPLHGQSLAAGHPQGPLRARRRSGQLDDMPAR